MFQFFFYACLVMLGIATLLGLAAVWHPPFWSSDNGYKVFLTSVILFGASVAAAAITGWLGK